MLQRTLYDNPKPRAKRREQSTFGIAEEMKAPGLELQGLVPGAFCSGLALLQYAKNS